MDQSISEEPRLPLVAASKSGGVVTRVESSARQISRILRDLEGKKQEKVCAEKVCAGVPRGNSSLAAVAKRSLDRQMTQGFSATTLPSFHM